MEKQINVVFKCNPKCWESDWVRELFNLNQFNIQDRDFVGENCIIVTDNPRYCLFENFIKKKKNFILINLKDEFIPSKQDYTIYQSSYCNYVFRNYFRRNLLHDNISFFPLGYKHDFWNGCDKNTRLLKQLNFDRNYLWSFAGVIKKSGRRKALWQLDKIKPNFIHAVSGWDTSDSLETLEYRELLCNSHFVPCFRGNCSLECFRIYESLECGAIPIVQKSSHIETFDFWSAWLGENHPLLVVDDIHSNQSFDYIHYYANHFDELKEKRLEVINWWNNYKKDYSMFASNIINKFFNHV